MRFRGAKSFVRPQGTRTQAERESFSAEKPKSKSGSAASGEKITPVSREQGRLGADELRDRRDEQVGFEGLDDPSLGPGFLGSLEFVET